VEKTPGHRQRETWWCRLLPGRLLFIGLLVTLVEVSLHGNRKHRNQVTRSVETAQVFLTGLPARDKRRHLASDTKWPHFGESHEGRNRRLTWRQRLRASVDLLDVLPPLQ